MINGGVVRLGIVGYGVGGRYFHAPFVVAAEGVELVGIVARAPETRAAATADLPGIPLFASLGDLIDAGVDAVTITTPPATRRDLVLEAVGRGIHVIADKPFAPTAEAGRALAASAAAAGVTVNVFHNRRRDADILTLQSVLESGALGEIWRFDNVFDLDQPHLLETGPDGGLLRDLGSHLIDQTLALLGPATHVYATLDHTDRFGEITDCGFVVTLHHVSGATSTSSSSKLNRLSERELRVYGSEGSYLARTNDVQAQAVFAGERPAGRRKSWGLDEEAHWGVLRTADGETIIPSAQGDYTTYYEEFAAAIAAGTPGPVPLASALQTLEVLDAARLSAQERRVVAL